MGHAGVQYTEEMEDYIRLKWVGEKWSAALIADALAAMVGRPFSRNMVIGKIFRMGLSTPSQARKPEKRLSSKGLKIARSVPRPPRPPLTEPEPLGYRLWEVPKNGCKYPHGDLHYTFCGRETIDTSSYCAYHYSMCYVASRYRRRPSSLGTESAPASHPPDNLAGAQLSLSSGARVS